MSPSLEISGHHKTKLGAVQINVVDYKAFASEENDITQEEMAGIMEASRRLIDNLRTFTTLMTPGEDKVATTIRLVNSEIGEKLILNLELGKPDDPFIKRFELPLPRKFRGKSVTDLHHALNDMSVIQPGGNIPNMVRNLVHAMRSNLLPPDIQMKLYSSDEPVFMDWLNSLEPEVRERIDLTNIPVPSRTGLHLPYRSDKPGGVGTLGLVSPMHSTIQSVEPHFNDLTDCNHVLVSESLAGLVHPEHTDYREFQNPSTAFREQCPLESYNLMLKRGRIPFISMNAAEMKKYLASVETRRALSSTGVSGSPLTNPVDEPSFSHPFDEDRDLNAASVQLVTDSFNRYFACITPHPEDQIYFPVSVSCDAFGGYHVASTPDGKRYVVFSSTPHKKGANEILKLIGPNDDIKLDTKRTMGAGDSVASVLSMMHLWNMEKTLSKMRSKSHPIDPKFIEVASTIFVSLLSRVAGEILYHSSRCDWTSVPPDKFPKIIQVTAKKSLDLAAASWNKMQSSPQVMREPKWDIDVAMWQL